MLLDNFILLIKVKWEYTYVNKSSFWGSRALLTWFCWCWRGGGVLKLEKVSCWPFYLLGYLRFQVLTAASMMFRTVFWDVLPCKMNDCRFWKSYWAIVYSRDVTVVFTYDYTSQVAVPYAWRFVLYHWHLLWIISVCFVVVVIIAVILFTISWRCHYVCCQFSLCKIQRVSIVWLP
jgi:hypothetical protein